MKRVHILERPISVGDLDSLEVDEMTNDWTSQKVERARLRKWRKVKHQAA